MEVWKYGSVEVLKHFIVATNRQLSTVNRQLSTVNRQPSTNL